MLTRLSRWNTKNGGVRSRDILYMAYIDAIGGLPASKSLRRRPSAPRCSGAPAKDGESERERKFALYIVRATSSSASLAKLSSSCDLGESILPQLSWSLLSSD